MTSAALKTYLDGVEQVAAPALTALDRIILGTAPDLHVAVRYKIVMYAVESDWQHWVCAVDAGRKGVCLRFLYGILLDDPLRVLRPGSSTLMTWDMPFHTEPDGSAVGAYVGQAVARYETFRADPQAAADLAHQAAAVRAAATGRRPRGVRS